MDEVGQSQRQEHEHLCYPLVDGGACNIKIHSFNPVINPVTNPLMNRTEQNFNVGKSRKKERIKGRDLTVGRGSRSGSLCIGGRCEEINQQEGDREHQHRHGDRREGHLC